MGEALKECIQLQHSVNYTLYSNAMDDLQLLEQESDRLREGATMAGKLLDEAVRENAKLRSEAKEQTDMVAELVGRELTLREALEKVQEWNRKIVCGKPEDAQVVGGYIKCLLDNTLGEK